MTAPLEEQRQQLLNSLRTFGIHDSRVIDAIAQTPRELFVAENLTRFAYADKALPIEMGQTISQPLMVAMMTQALRLIGNERVLEIGTGSGYQTAILARLAAHVSTVERYQQLSESASRHVSMLGLPNVSFYLGDGSLGWPQAAPYHRILVTAAAPQVPRVLLAQLTLWGWLVIPVGDQDRQELQAIQRLPWGTKTTSLGSCVFVPLVGEHGWSE